MVIPTKKSVSKANNVKSPNEIYSLVVDGNNLLKISLVNKKLNSDGEDYGAVCLFFKMLGDILKKKDFNYCTVCWDGDGSGVMRYELYKDYKANRDKHYEFHTTDNSYDKAINDYVKKVLSHSRSVKNEVVRGETDDESFARQKTIIQSILEELCIRQYEFDNVEGDDLIGYYARMKNDNEKVVIVSSDKDLTQLISDTVIVYNPKKRDFINSKNSVDMIGIRHDNVVLEKIICGDASDNIKGIKGVGETSLIKAFPELKEKKVDLDYIVNRSKELLEERKAAKKKPLKMLENIVNKVTEGIQGERIYEINEKIIDLSTPLLTNEAFQELKDSLYSPIDTNDRNVKNIYKIINENKMSEIMDEDKFGELFSPYSRIIMMENKRYKDFLKKC